MSDDILSIAREVGLPVFPTTEVREIYPQSILIGYRNLKEDKPNPFSLTHRITTEVIDLKRYHLYNARSHTNIVMGYGEQTDVLVYFWER